MDFPSEVMLLGLLSFPGCPRGLFWRKGGKSKGVGVGLPWVTPALLCGHCVALGKGLSLSGPHLKLSVLGDSSPEASGISGVL